MTTQKTMTTMSDRYFSREAVRDFIMKAPHRSLDVLRLMRDIPDASLTDVANSLGLDKRSIGVAVRNLNRDYRELTDGGELMTREGRSYQLTSAGVVVAEELSAAHQHLVEVLTVAGSKHREAWVPVATECIRYLPDLAKRLRPKEIIIKPSPKRSADLIASVSRRGGELRRRPYALFAACVWSDQIDSSKVSTITTITHESDQEARPTPSELIRIKDDPFRIVAPAGTFGRDTSVRLSDLWRMDLIVPDGGAVIDYLNLREPGWAQNRAHIRATNLQSVFACAGASKDLVPQPVMIFHGSDSTIERNLPRFQLFDIEEDAASQGGGEVRAVTGFFRDREIVTTMPPSRRDMWDQIWDAAARAWLGPRPPLPPRQRNGDKS